MRSTNNAKKMKKLQGKNTESEDMLIGLIFPFSTCPFYLLQENVVIMFPSFPP